MTTASRFGSSQKPRSSSQSPWISRGATLQGLYITVSSPINIDSGTAPAWSSRPLRVDKISTSALDL